MGVYIGLDIGGTKLMVAAAHADGAVIRQVKAPTPSGVSEGFIRLNQMIAQVAGEERVAGIGAAIGGPVDWKAGVVSPLHQPEWRDVPLKTMMQQAWDCPFFVDVDTNVAALAEYRFGREAGDPLLYITLSTGVGGGLVVNGQIYRGSDSAHPEIGHQSIPWRCSFPEKVSCECGAPDCLEALVSGNGIQRIYGRRAEELSALEWEEVAWNLGQGLRNLATIYAPAVIVLGGGVALGGAERLIGRAACVMAEHLRLVRPPHVRLSALGYDTALMGAIAVAISGLE